MEPTRAVRVIPMNDLTRGITRDRRLVDDAVHRVFNSGHVILGPEVQRFQEQLALFLDVTSVVGVASGTDALELSMKASMPDGKNTVLTAANAGGYSSTAARRAGFGLQYADVDPESLCLSEATVAAALTREVGVVVVTHLYGYLTDIRGLVAFCHAHGILVIEDCAQAIGARLPEGAAGSFGDLAAISFYPTKNLGALGDGGAVVTNSEGLASRVSTLRQYGWASKYNATTAGGVNSRLDEIQAAILLARLPLLQELNERRRAILQQYVTAAAGGPVRILPADGAHHVAHLAVGLTSRRDEIRAQLSSRGVATDIHFPVPDYQQPAFHSRVPDLPVTEQMSREVFSLPCFPELTDDEVSYICGAIGALQ